MRLDPIQVIVLAGRSSANQIQSNVNATYELLKTSGATHLLNNLDICSSQVNSAVVGLFSLYESRLQSAFEWDKPFKVISTIHQEFPPLDEEFKAFCLAVNVLKHGVGPSHTKLLGMLGHLPISVQSFFGELHEEGDVCPPKDLIVTGLEFLERSCDIVERSWASVRNQWIKDPVTMQLRDQYTWIS
jgi:hypothetical protein